MPLHRVKAYAYGCDGCGAAGPLAYSDTLAKFGMVHSTATGREFYYCSQECREQHEAEFQGGPTAFRYQIGERNVRLPDSGSYPS